MHHNEDNASSTDYENNLIEIPARSARSRPGPRDQTSQGIDHSTDEWLTQGGSVPSATSPAIDLYLDLLKRCLTRTIFDDDQSIDFRTGELKPRPARARELGRDWPSEAETMIGLRRLENIQFCVTDVLDRRVPGDLIETGVWRGGATIYMRAILRAYGVNDRIVWAADSFAGLPAPDPDSFPVDAGSGLHEKKALFVGLDEVKANFSRYGLLDDSVRFLVGWFRDTLPKAPIQRLAVLRLDGDMYESTMIALQSLYPKLSIGGYLIVDDYWAVTSCRKAVTEFRAENAIMEPIREIDRAGIFWQRES